MECFEKYNKSNPQHFDLCNTIGCALKDKGILKEAKIFFKQAIALNPVY